MPCLGHGLSSQGPGNAGWLAAPFCNCDLGTSLGPGSLSDPVFPAEDSELGWGLLAPPWLCLDPRPFCKQPPHCKWTPAAPFTRAAENVPQQWVEVGVGILGEPQWG